MKYLLVVSSAALAALVGLALLSLLWAWYLRRKSSRLCPGPKRPLWTWLLPPRWFFRRVCGYDLSGLRPLPDALCQCPECGRILQHERHFAHSTSRIRWAHCAAACVLLGWGILLTSVCRTGEWGELAPNWVVIAHERLLGTRGHRRLVWQSGSRLSDGLFSRSEIQYLIPAFIRDLRNDTISNNADRAMHALNFLGVRAVPALEAALDSDDWQQRQLAAHLLRTLHEEYGWDSYTPSDALLRVCVEGLGNDALPHQPEDGAGRPARFTFVSNARGSFAYLARYGGLARSHLEAGMRSSDPQGSLLCAAAAGYSQMTDLLPIAAPILVDRLESNDVDADAMLAVAALYRFGPDVLPYLEPLRNSPDPQQRDLVRLIALDLISSPDFDQIDRRKMQSVTTRLADPARDLDPDRIEFFELGRTPNRTASANINIPAPPAETPLH